MDQNIQEIIQPEVVDPTSDNNSEDSNAQLPRRSSRISNPPQRLNIESTKGQSYLCEAQSTCQSVSPPFSST